MSITVKGHGASAFFRPPLGYPVPQLACIQFKYSITFSKGAHWCALSCLCGEARHTMKGMTE